jgi:hypothetical protein
MFDARSNIHTYIYIYINPHTRRSYAQVYPADFRGYESDKTKLSYAHT